MAMRQIKYNVNIKSIYPMNIQDGGIKGDDNATEIEFVLSDELLRAVDAEAEATGYTVVFRVDAIDSSGVYHAGSNVLYRRNSKSVLFNITDDISQSGGVCTLHLVISLLNSQSNEETVIYSYPAKLYFTESPAMGAAAKNGELKVSGALMNMEKNLMRSEEILSCVEDLNSVLTEDYINIKNQMRSMEDITVEVTESGWQAEGDIYKKEILNSAVNSEINYVFGLLSELYTEQEVADYSNILGMISGSGSVTVYSSKLPSGAFTIVLKATKTLPKDTDINGINLRLNNIMSEIYPFIYPVGSIYMSVSEDFSTPEKVAAVFGGSWKRWGAGRVPVGVDVNSEDFYNANAEGGSYTQELCAAIGAVNSNTGTLAYRYTSPINGITYNMGILGNEFYSEDINKINHATLVRRPNGENATTVQPYAVCYMYVRVG